MDGWKSQRIQSPLDHSICPGSGKVLLSGDHQQRLGVTVLALGSSPPFLPSAIYPHSRHQCLLSPGWETGHEHTQSHLPAPQPLKVDILNVSILQVGPRSERLSNLAKLQLATQKPDWTSEGTDTEVLALTILSHCLPGAQDIFDRGTSEWMI